MKIIFTVLALSLFIQNASYAENSYAYNPYGFWLTQNERSVIKLEPCGEKLCGHITWIIEGGMKFDTKNPDEMKHDTPMCGLQVVKNLKKVSETKWTGGTIYKADDGDTYKANLTMMNEDEIKVRGYIGVPMLGKSQIWTRVTKQDYPICQVLKL